MLRPRNPLLVLVALLVIPLAAGALQPALMPLTLGLCALLAAAALLDLVRTFRRPPDLGVRLPEILRFSKDRPRLDSVDPV